MVFIAVPCQECVLREPFVQRRRKREGTFQNGRGYPDRPDTRKIQDAFRIFDLLIVQVDHVAGPR